MFFFFMQKTAYEMRISDWSSDVCSSDLRDIGLNFNRWGLPELDEVTFQSTIPKVFFGGDSAFGPKNIIWAAAHGHAAAISIDLFARGESLHARPEPMLNLVSQKMGIHEWSYDNDISAEQRFKVPWAPSEQTLNSISMEVELGFDEIGRHTSELQSLMRK